MAQRLNSILCLLTINSTPNIERHVFVHHSQERIHCYSILSFFSSRQYHLLLHNFLKLFKSIKLKLIQDFLFSTAIGISTLHCLIKKLIKIDVPIIISMINLF